MISSADFYIFRDSRRSLPATELLARMRRQLLPVLTSNASPDQLISVLLCAGELECALFDAAASAGDCERALQITDLCARAAVAADLQGRTADRPSLASAVEAMDTVHYAGQVSVSVPEGFAYYALHPLDYADLAARLRIEVPQALVIGVRSIGTTLSAVVKARLQAMEIAAERFTVRPSGHPYDRKCQLPAHERRLISQAIAGGATFFICDEGPGRSGSSLLSVAEALEREEVARDRIHILCSHQPDVSALCAPDAARRWLNYKAEATGMTRRLPSDAKRFLGGGSWRDRLISPDQAWPAVWPQMERLKYGSPDGRTRFTFEGYGAYGAEVRTRSEMLAAKKFSPAYLGQEVGFGKQVLPQMGAFQQAGLSAQFLAHLAAYCAWRAREFCVADANVSELKNMTQVNFGREFDVELRGFNLAVERPAICDAHMMPYAWLRTSHETWLKLNAVSHGDDHFFPGPCDIAWDLAGVLVEWNLSASARKFLLSEYRRASGDNAATRIESYELAYATFRMAWSRMAAGSVGETEEQSRLLRDYRGYRDFIVRQQATTSAGSRTELATQNFS